MGMLTHMIKAAECAARRLHGKGDFLSEVLAGAVAGTQSLSRSEELLFLEFPSELVKETFGSHGEKTSRVYLDQSQVLTLSEAELAIYIEEQTRQAFNAGSLQRPEAVFGAVGYAIKPAGGMSLLQELQQAWKQFPFH
jgi:hypothetical protein